MRVSIAHLLIAAAATLSAADDKAPFNGKWQVYQNIAGNESTQNCTFTQAGSEVTGTCGSDRGSFPITGKAEDKKISWSFKTEYNGTPLTVKYAGALDAQNKISGTVAVDEFSVSGDFSATPAK